MKALIPSLPDRLGGPLVEADGHTFTVMGQRGRAALVKFHALPDGVGWFEEFELLYAQQQHDPDILKVLRKASEDERRALRVPLWIQEGEVPECCGRPMFFVGQIDDDQICAEPPAGATMWWHDAASFYVFTCSQCLDVKAVGQQF